MFKQKYFFILLAILWMVTLYLMIQNYNQYPPLEETDVLYDRKNNIEGSVYKYGILSLVELVFGIAWMYYFFAAPVLLRYLVVVASIGFVVWGFMDAMYSGGVAATHDLWLTLEMLLIYLYIFFRIFKR